MEINTEKVAEAAHRSIQGNIANLNTRNIMHAGKTSYVIDQGKNLEEPRRSKLLKKYKFHKYYNQKLKGYGTKRK